MSNRIDATFARLQSEGKKAFIAYVSAGDPDRERSLEIIQGLAEAGADLIELGIPFSDPLADGVVNQLAAHRALQAGANTHQLLELIRQFRTTHQTPIILFTYLNPIYAYGYEQFHRDAATAGADGILLLDLPPDEAKLNAEFARSEGLCHITLIAPTTPSARVQFLAEQAEGFIYALSRTGVTGAHGAPSTSIGEVVARIKQHTRLPVCVGFGINTPEQVAEVAAHSDGVVVGSAIVNQIDQYQHHPDVAAKVQAFVTPLIKALRETP